MRSLSVEERKTAQNERSPRATTSTNQKPAVAAGPVVSRRIASANIDTVELLPCSGSWFVRSPDLPIRTYQTLIQRENFGNGMLC